MRFRYSEVPDLPALAWCARVDRGKDEIRLVHGSGVETRPHAFVEGAWDDDFASFNFIDATIVCGTGGRVDRGQVRFSGSTDRLCPLFSIAKRDSIFVSQSPAFVMATAGEAPDDIYPFYAHDFIRIFRQGLYCQNGKLKLQSGLPLRVHFSSVLTIDKQLTTTVSTHRLCESPRDFQSYKALLVEGVGRVLKNADDPARRRRYQPLAALSKGYDSSATAALASGAGCTEAVSSRDSRSDDPDADCASENAPYLGMTCTEYDRWEYLHLDRSVEPEFAYFTVASIASLAGIDRLLTGRILINGWSGDAVWNPRHAQAFVNLSRCFTKYITGIGQLEFRLRVGYQLFPAPMIAARHNLAIYAISGSKEMRPWSIGGKYDRPIPRRIAEEAGLPRERFGMSKVGTGHAHLNDPSQFSKKAADDYFGFVRARHANIAWPTRAYWWTRAHWRGFLMNTVSKPRFVPSSPLQRRFPFLLNASPIHIPYDFLFVFQWASAVMRSRYAFSVANVGER